ncbi:hypothetical protein F4776DRAFT_342846 [Hypoxylon sp. NC0597]|nr:hypothetical protein F4776DRAFT_342846 [Hypoxylon sp. NC0597]
MADDIELQEPHSRWGEVMSKAILNIFKDYLQSRSPVSAEQVALDISKLAPKPSGDEAPLNDRFFFELWENIIGIAEQIPYDHPALDKLVKVMRELTLLPDIGIKVWEDRVWIDLPVLGAVFREHLNGPRHSDDEEEQAKIDQAWIRFHAFSAKLMGAGVVYFPNQLIWMLREALEEETNPPKSSAMDRSLLTATMYIEFSGPIVIEALAFNPKPVLNEEGRRLLRGGSLYNGEPGLRLERWLFWIDRFEAEAEKTKTEDAKKAALRVAKLMKVWTEGRLKVKLTA